MKTWTIVSLASTNGWRSAIRRTTLLALVMAAFTPVWATSITAAEIESKADFQQTVLDKAYRHEKAGWVYLHIEGSARERGYQHGFLLAREISTGIEAMRGDWEFRSATEWDWLAEKASAMFEGKVDLENLAELDGIVEGLLAAGVEYS